MAKAQHAQGTIRRIPWTYAFGEYSIVALMPLSAKKLFTDKILTDKMPFSKFRIFLGPGMVLNGPNVHSKSLKIARRPSAMLCGPNMKCLPRKNIVRGNSKFFPFACNVHSLLIDLESIGHPIIAQRNYGTTQLGQNLSFVNPSNPFGCVLQSEAQSEAQSEPPRLEVGLSDWMTSTYLKTFISSLDIWESKLQY